MHRILLCCLLSLTLDQASAWVLAADVESDVSTRETYVGLPIVLRISINNAVEHETPIMPDVDGLQIELAGPPSRSSQTIWNNGRRTQRSTVSYAFRVTPLREGTFTIPPVKVVADGLASITKAVRIVASKSETDDLMFVEIAGSENDIYVGQALDLNLKVWVRPYRNAEYQIDLDEQDMWQSFSDQSSWGPFEDRLQELAKNRRRPGGQRVLREDSSGQEREYFLYELETTIYPDRPTTIDGQDVRIIMNYPVELGRSRSPFAVFDDDDFFGGSLFDDDLLRSLGSRLTVTKSRPIVAEAAFDPIRVKPVPTKGRPGDYVGAVGKYSIVAEATPRSVEVGEPITLRLGIDGDGSMEVVRAPPLALQQDLVRDFKVTDEPLAGFVDGSRKVFTTTLRPLRQDVTEIPPIEYTYFDPQTEEFVTARSEPISIDVAKADVLALDAIVGNRGSDGKRSPAAPPSSTPSKNSPPVAMTLFSGTDVLSNVARPTFWTPTLALILLGPIALFLLALGIAYRSLPGGWISARRRFDTAIERARAGSDVAAAMESYLTRRFRLAPERLTRDHTIGALRAAGRHDLAIRVERLYHRDETTEPGVVDQQQQEAKAIVREICAARFRSVPKSSVRQLGSTPTMSLLLLLVHSLIQPSSLQAASLDLTSEQQQRLLAEGVAVFESATSNPDRIEADEQFRDAADKFELLVDAGIENDRLYFNLGEAANRANQLGSAIANYRRALRLDPANSLYHERLVKAEIAAGIGETDRESLLEEARHLNDMVLRWSSPTAMLVCFAVAWLAFWIALSARSFGLVKSWKPFASLALALAILSGSSYLLRITEFTQDKLAVLISPTVSLRQGDGSEFAEVSQIKDQEGHAVQVLERRGEWLHIAIDNGQQGWIHEDDGTVL